MIFHDIMLVIKHWLNNIQSILTNFLQTNYFSFNTSRGYIYGCVSLNIYRCYTIAFVFIKIDHSFHLFAFKRIFQFCFNISCKFSLFWFSFIFFRDSSTSISFLLSFFIGFIFGDLNGSSYITFGICLWKFGSTSYSNIPLFTKLEILLPKSL